MTSASASLKASMQFPLMRGKFEGTVVKVVTYDALNGGLDCNITSILRSIYLLDDNSWNNLFVNTSLYLPQHLVNVF